MSQNNKATAKQDISRHDGSGQGAGMNQELQEWKKETEEIISELLQDGSDPDVEYRNNFV